MASVTSRDLGISASSGQSTLQRNPTPACSPENSGNEPMLVLQRNQIMDSSPNSWARESTLQGNVIRGALQKYPRLAQGGVPAYLCLGLPFCGGNQGSPTSPNSILIMAPMLSIVFLWFPRFMVLDGFYVRHDFYGSHGLWFPMASMVAMLWDENLGACPLLPKCWQHCHVGLVVLPPLQQLPRPRTTGGCFPKMI